MTLSVSQGGDSVLQGPTGITSIDLGASPGAPVVVTAGLGGAVIVSASPNALVVTSPLSPQPALRVDASAPPPSTGLLVQSRPAGGGVTITPLSTLANEALNLSGKGTG